MKNLSYDEAAHLLRRAGFGGSREEILSLADKMLIMQWSEFGRRPFENRSRGTDHGAASMMFVMGDPVRGGI